MKMLTRVLSALAPLALISGVVTALTVNVGRDTGTAAADVSATTAAATSMIANVQSTSTTVPPAIVVTSTQSAFIFTDTTGSLDVHVGQCFDLAVDSVRRFSVEVVGCEGFHGYQLLWDQSIDQSVVAFGGAFGGVPAEAKRVCTEQSSLKVLPEARAKLEMWWVWPHESSWPDDRRMQCVIAAPADMEWVGDALIVPIGP